MNNKDIFELFQNGFTARNTSDSYYRLCAFVSAMHNGMYFKISDEDIHRGVEYKKTEGKALLKIMTPSYQKKTNDQQSQWLKHIVINTFNNSLITNTHTKTKIIALYN